MKKDNKKRTAIWLYPNTMDRMDRAILADNCKSRSEFIEKALDFYTGYLETQDASVFLASTIRSGIEGTLKISENRISSNLFRLAVETNMMMHLLAARLDVSEEELNRLRGRCISDVKRSKGKISLDDAVHFQNGGDS